jgi:molecular chaperone GrpE
MAADPNADDPGEILDTPVEVELDPLQTLQAALEKAEAEKKTLEAEKKENWDKFLRAAADLENFRRRSKRDLDDARADAKTRVLKEMLPVVDNLERAVQHAEEAVQASELTAMVDGIRLVLRQFAAAFERVDVTAVEALGKPFDPNLHEAISQQETDEHAPGTVTSVLQRGYKLGDRLLRPALVVVAKAPSAPAPVPAPDGESAG